MLAINSVKPKALIWNPMKLQVLFSAFVVPSEK
jgi:hypothetical protein